MPTPFEFKKYGKSGIEVSDIMAQTGSVIDDVCVIRSMYSFNPTHTPSLSLYHTGTILLNRPSHGLVDLLRPRHGESESAVVRRAGFRRRQAAWAAPPRARASCLPNIRERPSTIPKPSRRR